MNLAPEDLPRDQPGDFDEILCHCDSGRLRELVEGLEQRWPVAIVRSPALCLTMIRAEDSLEAQPFYLGEALTTECEVIVAGERGIGLCLGEQPVRAYCIAVLDALREAGQARAEWEPFLAAERAAILAADRQEMARVLETRVDFKLLEQE